MIEQVVGSGVRMGMSCMLCTFMDLLRDRRLVLFSFVKVRTNYRLASVTLVLGELYFLIKLLKLELEAVFNFGFSQLFTGFG